MRGLFPTFFTFTYKGQHPVSRRLKGGENSSLDRLSPAPPKPTVSPLAPPSASRTPTVSGWTTPTPTLVRTTAAAAPKSSTSKTPAVGLLWLVLIPDPLLVRWTG